MYVDNLRSKKTRAVKKRGGGSLGIDEEIKRNKGKCDHPKVGAENKNIHTQKKRKKKKCKYNRKMRVA